MSPGVKKKIKMPVREPALKEIADPSGQRGQAEEGVVLSIEVPQATIEDGT